MKSEKWIILSAGILLGLVIGLIIPKIFTGGGEVAPPPPPITQAPNVDFQETINRLKALLEKDPGNYRGWVELGNAYYDSNQAAKAVEAYTKALAIDPSSPDVHTDLGNMYRNLTRFNEAVAEFKKAIELDPRHAQSRQNLGVILLQDLKDIKGAMQAWEDLLKIEPTGERADKIRQQLASMKEMMKQMDAAKKTGQPGSTDLPPGGGQTPAGQGPGRP